MSDTVTYDGKNYRISNVKECYDGLTCHLDPVQPFKVGEKYTGEEILDKEDELHGDVTFISPMGTVLMFEKHSGLWRYANRNVEVRKHSIGLEWICVYSDTESIFNSPSQDPDFKVGYKVRTQEQYDSLPEGTIVLDSCRGIAREAIQKRLHESVRTFSGEKIPHSRVFDFIFPPLTIVHIPDDDD